MLVALEVQLGYAISNKVNLLASNLNSPTNGRGGSSIISSSGVVLRKILTDQSQTRAIYANIQTATSAFQTSSVRFIIFISFNYVKINHMFCSYPEVSTFWMTLKLSRFPIIKTPRTSITSRINLRNWIFQSKTLQKKFVLQTSAAISTS